MKDNNQIGHIYNPLGIGNMYEMINNIYESVYIKHDTDIVCLNGTVKKLDIAYIKKNCINNMRKFSKTELSEFINSVKNNKTNGKTPSVQEVVDAYNEYINLDDFPDPLDYIKAQLTPALLRYYIKLYGISDLIQQRKRRTKEELKKDNTEQQI